MKSKKLWFFVSLCAAFLFAFSHSLRVQAHEVEPETSQPAAGAVLSDLPAEVVLVFPEELEEQGSSLQVLDASGAALAITGGGVDLNDAQHATLRAALPALAEGVYQVNWTIVLTDGDESSGSYHFGVGNVSVPTEPPEEEAAAVVEPAGQAQSGAPTWMWGVLAVLLVGAVVVIFALRGKK